MWIGLTTGNSESHFALCLSLTLLCIHFSFDLVQNMAAIEMLWVGVEAFHMACRLFLMMCWMYPISVKSLKWFHLNQWLIGQIFDSIIWNGPGLCHGESPYQRLQISSHCFLLSSSGAQTIAAGSSPGICRAVGSSPDFSALAFPLTSLKVMRPKKISGAPSSACETA